ncbi:LOG family protein [bacterium]|nr:LOG family protein [bacterium]MBR1620320.1 LOG family protein [bacterium]
MLTLEEKLGILRRTPTIDSRYYLPALKDKSVVILGSSKNSAQLDKYLQACSDITRHFVESGFNIISGAGTKGIMGEAYNTAYKYSKKDAQNRPVQNLGVLTEQLWGDENLQDCIIVGKAKNESERIEKFAKLSDKFVIFPGSAGSIHEATALVSGNVYSSEPKKIALFGKDFWEKFEDVYKKIAEFDLLKRPLDEIFKIVNSKDEVIKFFLKK